MTGIVFDIQRFALYDGPGIRTTVFLKGCPLRCQWCHNPESWSFEPQESTNPDGTKKTVGESVSVQTVLKEVMSDRAYYERSGGGVTFSGGEPLAQFEFCLALLQASKDQGLHTCLDTCGHVPLQRLQAALPYVDLFLFDYKATNPKEHKTLTGVGNHQILANLDRLYHLGAKIILRFPLIPGVNDSQEHLAGIASLNHRYPNLEGLEIMAYHNMGNEKALRLGQEVLLPGIPTADQEIKDGWLTKLRSLGCEKIRIG